MRLLEKKIVIEMERAYSITEVSSLLGCSKQNVLYLTHSGLLRSTRIGVKTLAVYGKDIRYMLLSGKHSLSRYSELLFEFI